MKHTPVPQLKPPPKSDIQVDAESSFLFLKEVGDINKYYRLGHKPQPIDRGLAWVGSAFLEIYLFDIYLPAVFQAYQNLKFSD